MARPKLENVAPVPRLALTVEEACAALGVGEDLWRAEIAPHVRIVRLGRRKLVAVEALQAFLDQRGERILDDLATGKAAPVGPKSPANQGVRARRAPVREAA